MNGCIFVDFIGGRCITEREIDALLIQPGDVLKVLPGTKVPADGVVVWGSSYVNESMVTGESAPVLKEANSLVIGGTINLHGAFQIQATKVGSDAVLNQIISLVETAQMSKAPIQKFADFVSVNYVGVMLCLYYNLGTMFNVLHSSLLFSVGAWEMQFLLHKNHTNLNAYFLDQVN